MDAYRQELLSLRKLEELVESIGIDRGQLGQTLKKAGIFQKAGGKASAR